MAETERYRIKVTIEGNMKPADFVALREMGEVFTQVALQLTEYEDGSSVAMTVDYLTIQEREDE